MTPIAAKVDTDAIVRPGGEWAHFKVNAARLKQQAAERSDSAGKVPAQGGVGPGVSLQQVTREVQNAPDLV